MMMDFDEYNATRQPRLFDRPRPRPGYGWQAGWLLSVYGPPGGPKRGMMRLGALRAGDVFYFDGYGPYRARKDAISADYWTTYYGQMLLMSSGNVYFDSRGVSGCQDAGTPIHIDELSPHAEDRKLVW